MAKSKSTVTTFQPRPRANRPGVVAKTKASRSKTSRNYLKRYRGQGR